MGGDITVTLQYLKGACKEARGNFPRGCSDRNNGLKLEEGEFKLHIQKFSYYEGDELPTQVAQRIWGWPISGSVKSQGGLGIGMVEMSLIMAGCWNQVNSKVPSNPGHFMILKPVFYSKHFMFLYTA